MEEKTDQGLAVPSEDQNLALPFTLSLKSRLNVLHPQTERIASSRTNRHLKVQEPDRYHLCATPSFQPVLRDRVQSGLFM